MAKYENLFGPGWDDDWQLDLTPVPPEEVPTDLFMCGLCDKPLPLLGVVSVEHDCETGEVTPIG